MRHVHRDTPDRWIRVGLRVAIAAALALLLFFLATDRRDDASRDADGNPVAAALPAAPAQPASGPGGAALPHAAVLRNRYGQGDGEVWVYEPSQPRPGSAPVVVFLHGWGGTNPRVYGAWIDHIARRGAIVVFPRYQADLGTEPVRFAPLAAAAVRTALAQLVNEPGHVQPRLDRVAYVGHSVGALIAATLAARADAENLPAPRAVMAVAPGLSDKARADAGYALPDLGAIPPGTLLLAVAGDADRFAGEADARRLVAESTRVAAADKNLVVLRSDDHGRPGLRADHFMALAPDDGYDNGEPRGAGLPSVRERMRDRVRERLADGVEADIAASVEHAAAPRAAVDALDWFGLWKLFDALTDAAFYGTGRDTALGDTARQRFMGQWSDGVAVREAEIRPVATR
ncbi:chlorophyllase/cutinase-like alpha/beta fold protein [Derxia gummosa]|uniref:Chlorophyllase/cutinase-like alpha/beta fold protein n=1 Tax=Derxia gummosa DSM 723 TaxID=1121388 RepID=A0A8B6XAM3_9BURK|nr:alpha/beta hydrolase fold domain-containing protein [Derxia gummosa]